jgi:hypothetical protein
MKVYNQPVEMIASFTAKGEIKPLRFKMADEQGFYFVVKDIQLVYTKKNALEIVYACNVSIDGRTRYCELHYDLEENIWVLFSIT